jgi:hypothetical protein
MVIQKGMCLTLTIIDGISGGKTVRARSASNNVRLFWFAFQGWPSTMMTFSGPS